MTNAVPLALVLPFSFCAIGPWIVSVGHSLRTLSPTWLTAGCVSGMTAPVKSPPVAIDPVPVAGHLAEAAVKPRHHGLKRTAGAPPDVVREKTPFRWFA